MTTAINIPIADWHQQRPVFSNVNPQGRSHSWRLVESFESVAGRVRGAGSANLRTEALDFVFRPRTKGFALFRPRNPLRVTGTLDDYRIGTDRRDFIGSMLRLLASPIIVPWERLTLGPLPRDGADVCADPLRQ